MTATHSPEPSTTDAEASPLSPKDKRVAKASARYSSGLGVWVVKIGALGLLDAIAIYGIAVAAAKESWLILAAIALIAIVANVIYLPPNRAMPAKYLFPGMIFMLIFSVGVMLYTIYVGFTNYGDGHNGSKADAIQAIQLANQERVANSPTYSAAVAERLGELWLITVNPTTQQVQAGSSDRPLEPVTGAQLTSLGAPREVPGYRILPFSEVSQRAAEVAELHVPISDDPNAGYIRTTTGSQAFEYRSTMRYDQASDTLIAEDGTTYRDGGRGNFISDSGQVILPGWQVVIGMDNFTRAVTDPDIRVPFLKVTAWTFAFAFLTVATTFALGLALALLFNDRRMRGQKVYRILMILPYAFPGFLSALVWAGLFNQEFGFINQVLLGGAQIPWLTDPWLAKAALIILNLWLGFPYMFLVATGALQSIPDDVLEAAKMDGANPMQTFMQIKLPLLMVPLAPLLISSFAFNFNNFVLVYMLTLGGPRFTDTSLDVGATDILISMVYKVAFGGAGRDYGLASAFSILIFLIVGVVSYVGFRSTKTLEDIN